MAKGYTLSSSEDIVQIGRTFADDNLDNFFCGVCPGFDLAWDADGVDTTTYHIASFDNSLQKGNGFQWRPGQDRPGRASLTKIDVTVTPQGYSTLTLGRSTKRTRAHIYEDLEANIIPILYSQMYQICDKAIVAYLTNASNFGQITLTGTGVLDQFGADTEPMWNILNQMIAPLRKYALSRPKAGVEMWVENHVLDIFASHFGFQGAGAAYANTTPAGVALSAGAMVQRRQGLISMLEANLGVRVVSKNATGDTAALGLTSAPAEIGLGLCWVGVVDRSADGVDLSSSSLKPDGALQLGWGSRPNIETWVAAGSKMEDFAGDLAFDVVSPRGSSWGFLIPVAQLIT